MKRRSLIYMRADEADDQNTVRELNAQLQACLKEIERLGAFMADFSCDVKSSADDLERPGLADLFRRLEGPIRNVDSVVTVSADRLASNPLALTAIKRRIERAGAELHLVDQDEWRTA